jgi:hypothetical protein
MQIACTTDEDPFDLIFSHNCEVQSSGEFSWKFGNWTRIARPLGYMHFSIYFYPRILWKNVSMILPGLESPRNGSYLLFAEQSGVSCSYYMKEVFSTEHGKHHVVILQSVTVQCPNYKTLRQEYLELENHKIVCLIRVYMRESHANLMEKLSLSSPILKRSSDRSLSSTVKSLSSRTIHLGRAQIISTNQEKGSRTYKWISSENNAFEGTSNPTLEDLIDADLISKLPAISPRKREAYIPDNDGFSNQNRVLPVDTENSEYIIIQFHNLKTVPPRFVEMKLRKGEMSKNIEIKLEDIEFHAVMENTKIIQITLKCLNYKSNLDKLGDGRELKTF